MKNIKSQNTPKDGRGYNRKNKSQTHTTDPFHQTLLIGLSCAIVGAIVGAIVSFILLVTWDNRKSEIADKKEADSIVSLLYLETGRIFGAIENNIKILEAENNSNDNKTLHLPMPDLSRLESNTWNSTKSKNYLFIKDTADLIQIENLYTLVTIINEQISFRENFINTNFNKPLYEMNLKFIDLQLLDKIKNAKKLNEIVQNYIYKFPVKYIGPDFEASKGEVKKMSEK